MKSEKLSSVIESGAKILLVVLLASPVIINKGE